MQALLSALIGTDTQPAPKSGSAPGPDDHRFAMNLVTNSPTASSVFNKLPEPLRRSVSERLQKIEESTPYYALRACLYAFLNFTEDFERNNKEMLVKADRLSKACRYVLEEAIAGSRREIGDLWGVFITELLCAVANTTSAYNSVAADASGEGEGDGSAVADASGEGEGDGEESE